MADPLFNSVSNPLHSMDPDFGLMRSGSAASKLCSFANPSRECQSQSTSILFTKPQSEFSRANIAKIPQTNKDFVFGYIRELFKQCNGYNLPQLIKYLCLLFWNDIIDEWDPQNKHSSIIIDNIQNSVKMKSDYKYRYKSAYLSKTVSSGTHIWTFKYIIKATISSIGIHKTNAKLTIARDMTNNKNDAKAVLIFGGSKKKGICKDRNGRIFGFECGGVETVKMKVDFKTLTLLYSIDTLNGGDFIEVTNIEKTEYRVGVTLRESNDEISVISYQHIY